MLLLDGQKFPEEQRDGAAMPPEGQKLPAGHGVIAKLLLNGQ